MSQQLVQSGYVGKKNKWFFLRHVFLIIDPEKKIKYRSELSDDPHFYIPLRTSWRWKIAHINYFKSGNEIEILSLAAGVLHEYIFFICKKKLIPSERSIKLILFAALLGENFVPPGFITVIISCCFKF
jgi:hypothetical protein